MTKLPRSIEKDPLDRIATTLSVIALTLADFRDRLEALERTKPTRWARFKAWLQSGTPCDLPYVPGQWFR